MATYRVRVERNGQIINVGKWSFPEFSENTGMSDFYGSGMNWSEMMQGANGLIARSGGKLTIFNPSTHFFASPNFEQNTTWVSTFQYNSVLNVVDATSIIGDKYILDNGSYYTVVRCTMRSAYLYQIEIKGYTRENAQAFDVVKDISISPYTFDAITLPFNTNDGTNKVGVFTINGSSSNPGWLQGQFSINNGWQGTETNRNAFFADLVPIDDYDPYVDIENSEPSGNPTPSGLPTNSNVNIPSLPSVSVADTGFITLFNPTLAQVKNLASYMWGSLFDISTFKKIFADPMDCILGFNLLPVAIPNGGTENVIVGNISTGVSMTIAGSQWVEVDCGTVNIGTPYDNYLDYSPYTKYSIYLPYIGTVDLSADDCVGKDIHLVYHVDVLSCSCVAYLKCGDSVMYQFTGSCGYSIPLTSENFRSMISSIVSIAGSIAGVVASGGASAPLTIGAVANTANNVMGLKPDVHRSGAIGSSAGLMGIQTPYLILQFPNPCKPAQQYKYMGYPSFVTVKVGDLSGYTEFDSIILDEVTCDEDEKQLIEDILKGGVFL